MRTTLRTRSLTFVTLIAVLALALAACGGDAPATSKPAAPASQAAPAPVVAPVNPAGPADKPAAAAEKPAAAAPAAAGPQKLTVAMGGTADTLDPHMTTSGIGAPTIYAVYDGLTYIDDKGQLKPALATEWKVVNPTKWEFKLRSGVKFHTGEDFTAEVVKWNIDRIINPDTKSPVKSRIPVVTSVDIVDASTVQLNTSAPDPILDKRMAVIFMVAPKEFERLGATEFGKKGSGTGSFKAIEYQKDNFVELEAFKQSWRGAPKLDRVSLKGMPEASVRVAALRAGEVDMVHNLPTSQAADLQRDGFGIQWAVVARAHHVGMAPTRHEAFKDKRVRQALNYAVDKDAIIKNIMHGYAKKSKGQFVDELVFGFNPDLKEFPYDPAKAKQLLAEAGYANGFSVKMTGSNGFFPNDKETIEAISGYLDAVGVKVQVQVEEVSVWIPKFFAGQHEATWFQGLNWFPVMDSDFPLTWYYSQNRANVWNSPQFDALYKSTQTELDKGKREAAFREIFKQLNDDPPSIYLFQPPDLFAVSKKVQGFVPRADLVIWFDTIYKS
ncbi:MAG: hypothetical protein HY329_00015 [Chloroflexi bacterium]|nr:hypothetical protein [Chloroflexota bacterium]